jgi:hypothetical protein
MRWRALLALLQELLLSEKAIDRAKAIDLCAQPIDLRLCLGQAITAAAAHVQTNKPLHTRKQNTRSLAREMTRAGGRRAV